MSQNHGVTRIEFREQIHMIKRNENLPADVNLSLVRPATYGTHERVSWLGTSSMARDARKVAVVVRYTHYDRATPEQCLALMSWHEDLADADVEAARLNSVRPNDRVEYFVKVLRYRSS